MGDGWRMLLWGGMGAFGALTLLRYVADEVARSERTLHALERRERKAREKRNEEAQAEAEAEAEGVVVAETVG